MVHRGRLLGALAAGLLLVGLVFMIQAAQKAADQTTCESRIRMIGLALNNYSSARGTFPPATIPNEHLPPWKRLSWTVSILTFWDIGGQWLIDESKAWDEGENRLVRRTNGEGPGSYVAEKRSR